MTTVEHSNMFDPRPTVIARPNGHMIAGGRCESCGHTSPGRAPRCPRCAGGMLAAEFGSEGTVWSTTTIRVASGNRAAPYTLAYVDLDAGPRILAHVGNGPAFAVRVAQRVRLVGLTDHGDPLVAVIG